MTGSARSEAPADVLIRLRRQTQAVHAEVEAALDLMAPRVPLDRYRAVLARLHGVHAAAEPGLDEWHRRGSGLDQPRLDRPLLDRRRLGRPLPARPGLDWALLDWPGRRKLARLEADLADVGLDRRALAALPVAPLPPVRSTPAALGTLYVLEGATLGGRVIGRHVGSLPGFPVRATRFLSGYGDDTGRRWHAWRRTTLEWVGEDEARAAAVVAAGLAVFTCVRDWCAPLADGVAA